MSGRTGGQGQWGSLYGEVQCIMDNGHMELPTPCGQDD